MEIVSWFENKEGQLTYSMIGSRIGTDGTADCSGSITQSLKEAGAQIDGVPSTVTLGYWLAKNNWIRIAKNEDWNAQRNDIVMMSWGVDMSQSGGAGGHVGAMMDSERFISTDYSTSGAIGTAVSIWNWNDYYLRACQTGLSYIEVWRYNGDEKHTPTSKHRYNSKKAFYRADSVVLHNGIWQVRCDELVPVGFDWTENGIPIALINWVDSNGNNVADGNDWDFKTGMYFNFEIDENSITDTGDGGYYGGYYYRKFGFGQFGDVWLSAWNKNHLVNG